MGRNKFAAVVWPARDIIIIIIIIIVIIIFIYRTRAEHKIQKLNSVYKSTKGYHAEKLQLIDLAAYANQTKLFSMNCNNNSRQCYLFLASTF